jgi:hypothetical protein
MTRVVSGGGQSSGYVRINSSNWPVAVRTLEFWGEESVAWFGSG